jgi:hypothetical protein
MGSRWPSRNVPDAARLSASHSDRLSPSFSGDNELTRLHLRSEEIGTGEFEDAVSAGMKVAGHRTVGDVGSTPAREAGGNESLAFHSYVAAVR